MPLTMAVGGNSLRYRTKGGRAGGTQCSLSQGITSVQDAHDFLARQPDGGNVRYHRKRGLRR